MMGRESKAAVGGIGALALVAAFMTASGPSVAQAAPALTYHGRLVKSDSTPVTSSQVDFRVRIYSPAPESCV